MSIQLRRPTLGTVRDPHALLDVLTALYDAAVETRKPLSPARAPALQAITLPTFARVRATRGDAAGLAGPLAVLVAGKTNPADSGKGAFAWDPTSTAADDDTNTLAVAGVPTGRWRRIL